MCLPLLVGITLDAVAQAVLMNPGIIALTMVFAANAVENADPWQTEMTTLFFHATQSESVLPLPTQMPAAFFNYCVSIAETNSKNNTSYFLTKQLKGNFNTDIWYAVFNYPSYKKGCHETNVSFSSLHAVHRAACC